MCVCVCVCVKFCSCKVGWFAGCMSFLYFIFCCCWVVMPLCFASVILSLLFGCCGVLPSFWSLFLHLHFGRVCLQFSVSSFLVAVWCLFCTFILVAVWCLSVPLFLVAVVPFLCLLASVCKESVSVWVKGGQAWSLRRPKKK